MLNLSVNVRERLPSGKRDADDELTRLTVGDAARGLSAPGSAFSLLASHT